MALDLQILTKVFSRKTYLYVTEIGAPDFTGMATCRLSDGSFVRLSDACIGMVGRVIEHFAEIRKYPDHDKITIVPWEQEPIDLSMEDVLKLVEKYKAEA